MTTSIIEQAIAIAVRDLRGNYRVHGIVAGATHFSSYWLRDQCFASLGALALGDGDVVRRGFEFFMSTQRADGLIAYRAGWPVALQYVLSHGFGISFTAATPRYLSDKLLVHSRQPSEAHVIDSFPLLFVIIAKYLEQTGDTSFIQPYVPALERLLQHYLDRHVDPRTHLIVETPYAGWMDSIKKQGMTLTTNVLYVAALRSFCTITGQCQSPRLAESYRHKFDIAHTHFQQLFWNQEYFHDWIDGKTIHDTFTVDGNLLAIMLGLTTDEQADSILDFIARHTELTEPVACKTNTPAYPHQLEYWALASLEYHNASSGWLWLGAISAIALHKRKRTTEAKQRLEDIARTIVTHGTVYEIYDPKGKPYANFLYRSERAFSWSAGLFIWAAKELGYALPVIPEKLSTM